MKIMPWSKALKKENLLPTDSGHDDSTISPVWSDISGHHEGKKHTTFLQPVIVSAKSHRTAITKWIIGISVVIGIVGIAVGTVGIVRWQSLKKEVDRLHGEVDKLHNEVGRLHNEVDHFASLNEDLNKTNHALEGQVQRLDSEITKFSELSESIRVFVNKTSEGFDEVLDQAHSLFTNISDRLGQIDAINKDTRRALELQLASEKRERYLSYATIASATELTDGAQGFTSSEWDDLAARIAHLDDTGTSEGLSQAEFLQRWPFAQLANATLGVIPFETVLSEVIPNLVQ